jgi:IS5 family transposase
MKKDITGLFVFVDDFCKGVDEYLSRVLISCGDGVRKVTRVMGMTLSELLTIELFYHDSPCKNFQYFYQSYLPLYREEFPHLVSYHRFVELKPRILSYLLVLLQWFCAHSDKTGIAYMDTTSLAVCHGKRISRNKVFQGLARLGKTTRGWFFGFKLHLVINESGQLHKVKLTRGNVDDRTPVPDLVEGLEGLLFADKGYIKAELFQYLYAKGLKLVTGIKKNMTNKMMPWIEKILLRKRSIIETVFSVLKKTLELEHTRHRSPTNAFVHILSTLVAYCLKTNKPAIKFNFLIPN